MLKFKPGDIGFLMQHKSWISRAIAWFMGSRWSHTLLVFGEIPDRHIMTTETNSFCVKHGALTPYLQDPEVSFEIWSPIGLSDQLRVEIADCSLRHVDEAYGWLQLFSFAVKTLLKRVGITIPNFIRQGLVCAHVAIYAYQDVVSEDIALTAIKSILPVDVESIDTEELYKIISACGKFEKVFEKNRG